MKIHEINTLREALVGDVISNLAKSGTPAAGVQDPGGPGVVGALGRKLGYIKDPSAAQQLAQTTDARVNNLLKKLEVLRNGIEKNTGQIYDADGKPGNPPSTPSLLAYKEVLEQEITKMLGSRMIATLDNLEKNDNWIALSTSKPSEYPGKLGQILKSDYKKLLQDTGRHDLKKEKSLIDRIVDYGLKIQTAPGVLDSYGSIEVGGNPQKQQQGQGVTAQQQGQGVAAQQNQQPPSRPDLDKLYAAMDPQLQVNLAQTFRGTGARPAKTGVPALDYMIDKLYQEYTKSKTQAQQGQAQP